MYALIQMLHNSKANTYHPIFYFDSPFPGGFDEKSINRQLLRYKSKGHHTAGFPENEKALEECQKIKAQLEGKGYYVTSELIDLLDWDGEGIPADVVLRPYPTVKS